MASNGSGVFVAVLLAALLLVPSHVLAQTDAAANPTTIEIATDKTGDVAVVAQQQPVPASPPGAYDYIDLVKETVLESQNGFHFTVQVAALKDPSSDPSGEYGQIDTYFRHHNREFILRISGFVHGPNNNPAIASLYAKSTGSESYGLQYRRSGIVQEDVAAGTLGVDVARDDLLDSDGARPFPGRSLDNFTIRSQPTIDRFSFSAPSPAPAGGVAPFGTYDRMPDSGIAPGTVPIAFGAKQSGHAVLVSKEPFRASNGQATTYVYTVVARNLAATKDTFTLAAKDVPAGWNVTFPVSAVEIEGNGNVTIPVLLSVPFAHQHGTAPLSFKAELHSDTDPQTVGRIELGIEFLSIPQPAGHHDTVWFHSRTNEDVGSTVFGNVFPGIGADAYMNAVENFEADEGVPVTGNPFISPNGAAPQSGWVWDIPLDPGLRIGLDFDLAHTGKIAFPISTVTPLVQSTITGTLVLIGPANGTSGGQFGGRPQPTETVLATFASNQTEVSASSSYTYEAPVVPTPESDFIKYDVRNDLELRVILTTGTPNTITNAQAPSLQKGGSLRLPLFEYSDPVSGTFSGLTGPILTVAGQAERLVNAGRTAAFQVTLQNQANDTTGFALTVTGPNSAWVILPADHVTLAGKASQSFIVGIAAPPSATKGDRADVLLQATADGKAIERSILRLVVVVDPDNDHPDESSKVGPKVEDKKKSPGIETALLVGALAALVAVSRRRR